MFVRVRVSPMNMEEVRKAVQYYLIEHKIPVVFTFMRYYNIEAIPDNCRQFYEYKKHVLNSSQPDNRMLSFQKS